MATLSDSSIRVALNSVLKRMETALKNRPKDIVSRPPRLVAVTKTKPAELVVDAYGCGQREFGENYVNEITQKSVHPEILDNCQDIKWHFIGNLQRKNVNKLLSIPNLEVIETIDSEKLAEKVSKSWDKVNPNRKLKVMVQVNTSGEDTKGGCSPEEAPSLMSYVLHECPNLELSGLMTIGRPGHDPSNGPCPDFVTLLKIRDEFCKKNDISPERLELSMGMSADFEHAIEMGSTNVRVGSTIFGSRSYPTSKDESNTSKTQTATNSQPQDEETDNFSSKMEKLAVA